MIRQVARVAALLVAGPYLLLVSALAPEHIHEPGHGHEHAVGHNHFGPHAAAPHADAATEIEQDDAGVIWLDHAVVYEQSYQASPVPVPSAAAVEPIARDQWSSIPADAAAPAHGPPRAPQPDRGPPFLPI